MKRVDPGCQKNRLPDSFFEVLGTWEDYREPEEILRDIRQEVLQRAREELRPVGNTPGSGGTSPEGAQA
jgi:hypothetical protein